MFDIGPCPQEQLPADYQDNFLFRWKCAVCELTQHLRDDALLPLSPASQCGSEVFKDLESGFSLPVWHCPFVTHDASGQPIPCRATAKESHK